ncbi:MAG: hypothetical protein PHG54_01125 [Smithellaceae bacterium]|jgi:hypothetical protein|nr:hypothetical protein [Smithellaceae bacterium]
MTPAKKFCDFPAFFFDFSNDRGFIPPAGSKNLHGTFTETQPTTDAFVLVQNNSALMESDGDGIRWAQIFAVLALYATIRPVQTPVPGDRNRITLIKQHVVPPFSYRPQGKASCRQEISFTHELRRVPAENTKSENLLTGGNHLQQCCF